MNETIYNQIYNKLILLIPNLENMKVGSDQVGKAPYMMDLHVEVLSERKKYKHKLKIISMSHYYEQNGDLIPDPDMTIGVYNRHKTAEALTFQNSFIYQEVYQTPTMFYPKLKKQLNSFLNSWLNECLQQKYVFINDKINLED
jgi:uncharacterized protein YqiB (DUF1249 family)